MLMTKVVDVKNSKGENKMKEDVIKVTIKNVASYQRAGGQRRFLITADIGKFSCDDAEIAEKLSATKGAPICIEVDGNGLIIGIVDDATPEEAVDETMPFPEETGEQSIPSDTKPAAQPKTQSAPPKAEPTSPKATKPAPPPQKDVPKAAAKQEPPAKKAEPKTPAPAPLTTSYTRTPTFAPDGAFAFPLLEAQEIEVRVGQINDKGATFLLYKDARCDQDRLDLMFGPANWQSLYLPSPFANTITCRISIRINGEWISKENGGVASQTEPEKGAYSDAFKRAMVEWGSGRELYSAPVIWIPAEKLDIRANAKGKPTLYDNLCVTKIDYNEKRDINRLVIAGKKGVVFDWTRPTA
jgi:hypothetical protein